jgi:hypothetical protein
VSSRKRAALSGTHCTSRTMDEGVPALRFAAAGMTSSCPIPQFQTSIWGMATAPTPAAQRQPAPQPSGQPVTPPPIPRNLSDTRPHVRAVADHPLDPLDPPPSHGGGDEPHRHHPLRLRALRRRRNAGSRWHSDPDHCALVASALCSAHDQARPDDLSPRLRDRRLSVTQPRLRARLHHHGRSPHATIVLVQLPPPRPPLRGPRTSGAAPRRAPQARARRQPPPSCAFSAIHLPQSSTGGGKPPCSVRRPDCLPQCAALGEVDCARLRARRRGQPRPRAALNPYCPLPTPDCLESPAFEIAPARHKRKGRPFGRPAQTSRSGNANDAACS